MEKTTKLQPEADTDNCDSAPIIYINQPAVSFESHSLSAHGGSQNKKKSQCGGIKPEPPRHCEDNTNKITAGVAKGHKTLCVIL